MIQGELNSLIRTNNENNYYLSRSRQTVLFLHPVLKHLIALHEQGKLEDWLEAVSAQSPDQVNISDGMCVSKRTILYYHRYFLFLEEKGFFEEVEKHPMPPNRYSATDIKKSLANSLQVVFEVTQSCNLKCTYCGYGDFYDGNDTREDKNLDIDAAKKLIDYMIDFWESPLNRSYFKKIHISFYGGEPLLNMPFIQEIVEYVKGKSLKHNSFQYSMTTNGVLLDKYMDFLAANNFRVAVSLDGNKENNGYRVFADGGSSFETVYANVLALRSKYPVYFDESVHFLTVLHDKNSNKTVRAFFEKEFQCEPSLAEVNSLGIKPSKRAAFEKMFKNKYSGFDDKDLVHSTRTKGKLLKTPFVSQLWSFLRGRGGYIFRKYDHLIRSVKNPWVVSTGTCDPFSKKIFLTAAGALLPCERIFHVYSLGRVDENGVQLDYEAIAAKINKYYEKLMPQCNRCAGSDGCGECIFSFNTNDGYPCCENIKDGKKVKEDLQFQLTALEEIRRYYPEIMRHYNVN